jgi:succinate dehydrogenase/fumarate reductase flavoprotein subunit
MTDLFDLVVIGGGIAGWTAARRSQGLGASVALLESGTDGHGASGSRLSGGRVHAAYYNPRTHSPDELYTRLMQKTGHTARRDVTRAWADNACRAVEFLVTQGAEFVAVGPEQYLQTALKDGPQIPSGPRPRGVWRDRGPDRLLTQLCGSFIADGGYLLRGVRATAIEMTDGAVAGVRLTRADVGVVAPEIVRGRAVLIADGGFAANRELMVQYGVTRHSYSYGCSEYARGDGLKMAIAVGAGTHNLDAFYGYIAPRDSAVDARLDGTPLNVLMDAGIVVNGGGERIGDEAYGTEEYSLIDWPLLNAVAKTEALGDSWVIVDDAVWQAAVEEDSEIKHPTMAKANADEVQAERARIRSRAGELRARGRVREPAPANATSGYVSAATLHALAVQMSVPASALARTVDTYNRFVREEGEIEPPRSGRPEPLTQSPFHAIAVVPHVQFTQGGILINGHAQVLDQRERPISGLYAAGNAAGGLQGGPQNGYAGGWSAAMTFGMLAAEHAAKVLGGAGAQEISAARSARRDP